MADLVLRGIEHVYDAFDEYEHPNDISLRVSDMSLGAAVAAGESLLQEMVLRDRRAGGYMATGSFVAELLCIEDADGFILYQSSSAVAKGLRYFGGDLEDYRDSAGPLMFLSYSHRDDEFVKKLSDDIARRGFRTWMDHNDLGMEKSLLNFGRPTNLPPELKTALERAVKRSRRLLLIVSEHSVQSDWVQVEVGFALREGQRDKVPIDHIVLDKSIEQNLPPWLASIGTDNMFDFSSWHDSDTYYVALRDILEKIYRYKGP